MRADVAFKHEQMALAPFPFLRSTFYRWVQVWEETCPELASAPTVLAVGDLHTQNFGTWRDTEGTADLGHQRLRRGVPDGVHQ